MARIYGFPPVETIQATVLILGSMPGVASLRAGEYYAHPRNQFWRMMQALISLDAASGYQQRVGFLHNSSIALWDVLHSCTREGSLDTRISQISQVPNDFATFFSRHENITHVFFNGKAAEQIYCKRVLPHLNAHPLEYRCLPSTSPAHAAQNFEQKLLAWRAVLEALLGSGQNGTKLSFLFD